MVQPLIFYAFALVLPAALCRRKEVFSAMVPFKMRLPIPSPCNTALGLGLITLLAAGMAVAVRRDADVGLIAFCAAFAFLALKLKSAQTFSRTLAMVTVGALVWCGLSGFAVFEIIVNGAFNACLYGAFMAAVIALRDPIDASPAFGTAKALLGRQVGARAYPVLLAAGHILSLVLHMGSIGLLGALTNTGDGRVDRWAATAALHGFFTTTLWSPLSVAPAVVLTNLPHANHGVVLALGLAGATIILAASLIRHWLLGPRIADGPAGAQRTPVAWLDFAKITAMILAIFVALQAATAALHVSALGSVVIIVPFVVIVMILFQSLGQHGLARARDRLASLIFVELPARSDEIVLMVIVGFLGAAVSRLVQTLPISQTLFDHHIGAVAVLLGCFWAIILAAMAGLTGLVTVVVLMQAIPAPDVLGVPPELVAIVFIAGWSISAAASPLTPTTLLVAQGFRISPTRVAWVWNGGFSLALVIAASAAFSVAIWLTRHPIS